MRRMAVLKGTPRVGRHTSAAGALLERKGGTVIQMVMKPDKAPVVNHEGVYRALFGGEDIGFRVRARNAREAERKLMIAFRHELTNKTIDFKPEDYPAYDKEECDEDETEGDRPEDGRAADPDPAAASGAA